MEKKIKWSEVVQISIGDCHFEEDNGGLSSPLRDDKDARIDETIYVAEYPVGLNIKLLLEKLGFEIEMDL